jgi:predicted metalloprotease
MRWEELPRSDNIEDRTGDDGGGYGGGYAGGGGMPIGGGGLGIGGIIILGILGYALGIDPRILIAGADIFTGGGSHYQQPYRQPAPQGRVGQPTSQTGQFVSAVLGSTEVTWKAIFQEQGQTYRPPRLVMFSNFTRSGCGAAQSAMGPFYCPNDREVYLDASFFRDLETRFRGCTGKACEFSRAYVIAHEVGHHVQNLLGILPKAQRQQQGVSRVEANRIQVRVELQADCLAGVWANRAEQKWKFIDPGDIDAALQTASAIGDDMLQRRAQGRVVPDSFTHGTSEQRKRWFSTGFQQGKIEACNTFAVPASSL